MAYSYDMRSKAIELRRQGYSLKELSKEFNIAKSTAALWTRDSFVLDESKFHPCIHLHSYHSPEKQLDFWSKVTHINKQQFIKSYQKPNSGKRIHADYQGCINIRYASNDLARRLMAIARAFLDQ